MEQKNIAGFDLLEIPGEGPTIVLLHGFGADAYDLLPIAQSNPGPRWIIPNGPLTIPIAPGYNGRAWFPIDIDLLQHAIQSEQLEAVVQAFPPEITDIREQVQRLIGELEVPASKVILGGFSQGAVLATDLALHAVQKIAALIILSGAIINRKQWHHLAHLQAGLPFFQSHGHDDPLLPFEMATALEQLLVSAGLKGKLMPFKGGHEIPQKVSEHLHRFITQLTA